MVFFMKQLGEFINLSTSIRQRIVLFVMLGMIASVLLICEQFIDAFDNHWAFYSGLILMVVVIYSFVSLLLAIESELEQMRSAILDLSKTNYQARLDLCVSPVFVPLVRTMNDLVGEHERSKHFLKTSADETQHTASELETESQCLSNRVGEQSRRLEMVASASEEISATVTQINQSVQETYQIAGNAYELSETSRTTARHAVDEISVIAKSVEDTVTKLKLLDNKSNEIVGITNIIEDITRQIHLLALNAAIEAARAGEAGSGFAVVADEIQTLASRTSSATNDISQVLHTISSDIREAVETMDENQDQLNEGVLLVQNTDEALSAIESGASKTRTMIEEMLHSIEHHVQANTSIAESIEDLSCLAEENHQSSKQTLEMVRYLRNLSERFIDTRQAVAES